jgi:hypothetical protein
MAFFKKKKKKKKRVDRGLLNALSCQRWDK